MTTQEATEPHTNGTTPVAAAAEVAAALAHMQPSRAAEHCSPTIFRLATALAQAQGEFGKIERNREVEVQMRKGENAGGKYTFKYATLDEVLAKTIPALTKYGLSIVSLPNTAGERRGVRTVLLHASGEFLAVELVLPPSVDGAQELGKAITYLRRYSITCLLGVAAEDDNDASESDDRSLAAAPRDLRKAEPPAPAGPWRAQGDDGTPIMDAEIEDFDAAIKKLQYTSNYVGMWLFGRFGVRTPRELTRAQFKVAAKLLTADGVSKDAYKKALQEAIAAGQVKA